MKNSGKRVVFGKAFWKVFWKTHLSRSLPVPRWLVRIPAQFLWLGTVRFVCSHHRGATKNAVRISRGAWATQTSRRRDNGFSNQFRGRTDARNTSARYTISRWFQRRLTSSNPVPRIQSRIYLSRAELSDVASLVCRREWRTCARVRIFLII